MISFGDGRSAGMVDSLVYYQVVYDVAA